MRSRYDRAELQPRGYLKGRRQESVKYATAIYEIFEFASLRVYRPDRFDIAGSRAADPDRRPGCERVVFGRDNNSGHDSCSRDHTWLRPQLIRVTDRRKLRR